MGLVALPLAIVFAVAAGARAEQGLYSAIIGGFVIALFSGSRYQVSGPTGAFVIILLGIVNQHGMEGLILAGVLAGIILVLMGLFQFGSVIKFIPYPVVVGFTAGIGTLIFISQIKDFLGLPFVKNPHGFIEIVRELAQSFRHGVDGPTMLIGLITLSTAYFWGRFVKKFPASPIALAAGILTSLFFGDSVARIGNIPTGLPVFHPLYFSFEMLPKLLPAAFTIAMLGAIESLLSAVAADGMSGTKHNSNKELIAQGIGNIIVPFFGGIPVTGAIARTATNIKNGARTQVSSIVHSITLLLIILFFAPYAKHIPLAALAAILMTVAYQMSEPHHFLRLFKAPPADVAVLLTTFLLTIFFDLTMAVGAGVVLAALLFIKRVSEINIRTLEDNTKDGSEAALRLQAQIKDFPQITLYEINGPMFFGAASILEESIAHEKNEILILTLKNVNVIDVTAIHALELILEKIGANGGTVILASLQPKVRQVLKKQGLLDKQKAHLRVARNIDEAIAKAKEIAQK